MKYSTDPGVISKSFWNGAIAIAEKRSNEINIYWKNNYKIIKFPVGDKEFREATLSCRAPDGKERTFSVYDENNRKVILSINDQEGRREAIHRAIKDLMARTLKRKEENKGKDFNKAIEDALLPNIYEWLNDSRKDFSEKAFDEWHAKTCDKVLKVLQDYYTNNNETEVEYGKAQKIVNMTMKGLYCLKDADQKDRYFEHCHTATTSPWLQGQ